MEELVAITGSGGQPCWLCQVSKPALQHNTVDSPRVNDGHDPSMVFVEMEGQAIVQYKLAG